MAEVGTTLAGRYELGRPLGRGGMGVVFRAYDRELARHVAVKVLDPSTQHAGDVIAKFRREARAAATLNHRNVVSVHDVGDDGGEHYIVMELVEGRTLEDVIGEHGPLEPVRALAITQGILDALGAAHDAGLVHRDVKPGNVMFDQDGVVKVTDFGLARSPAERTSGDHVYGSAPFMAPEQAKGGPLDPRTDLYAAGSLLFAMLTGRPPFVGDADLAVLYQHLHSEPPAPSELRPELPAALDALVMRALEKDPDERYPDVASFRRDIDRIASGRAPLAAEEGLSDDQLLEPSGAARSDAARVSGRKGDDGDVLITSSRVRGRKRMFGLIALLTAAVVALAVLLLTRSPEVDEAEVDPIDALETPLPTPSPEASPEVSVTGREQPESGEPASVEAAVARLIRIVSIGQREGEVTEAAADRLARRGALMVRWYRDGELGGVVQQVAEARRDVDRLEAEGQIVGDRADLVRDVLDGIERLAREQLAGEAAGATRS